VARLLEPPAVARMARVLASMLAFRLLSSVLMARGRASTLALCWRELARLSSLKILDLWAKRSRIRRYECFSSRVMELSTRGRRMHGARLWARAVMYVSSAEVSSIRRVKWVMSASSVAIFAKRSWIKVFCRTEIRAASLDSDAVVL
jgi:hypothetical protein